MPDFETPPNTPPGLIDNPGFTGNPGLTQNPGFLPSILAVPEPSSFQLLGLALLAVWLWGRRSIKSS